MWKLSLIEPIVIHQVVSGLVTSQYMFAVRTYLYPNRQNTSVPNWTLSLMTQKNRKFGKFPKLMISVSRNKLKQYLLHCVVESRIIETSLR